MLFPLSLFCFCAVCGSPTVQAPPSTPTQDSDRVELRIREAQRTAARRLFEIEYSSGGSSSRFALVLANPPSPRQDMPVVRAALVAREPSDASQLLAALARLHRGQVSPGTVRRLPLLHITAAILGDSLSHGRGRNIIAGEFTPEPRGDWLVLKLFLDTPDHATTDRIGEPAELFIALSPSAGRGWFLAKDPEYWPELNRVLATIL